jgi:hypothetical protein
MSFLTTINTSVQSISDDQGWSSLLKYNQSALQVSKLYQATVDLVSGVVKEVSVSDIPQLQILTIKATQPVDLSLKTDGSDLFMGLETKVIVLVEPDGVIFDHLKLRSSTNSVVELAIGGLTS